LTISANSSFNPQVDTILRMALQMAGLLPLGRNPSAAELAHARDHMNASLKSLSGVGPALTQMERTTLALVAGTSTYVLAADTIEVSFPMSIAVVGQTTETWIEHMTFATYQTMSSKDLQGTPTSCYVEKLSTVSLVFWPVPSQAYTLSYQRQRLIRDADSGSTVDLTQRWFNWLTYEMAHKMSLAGSLTLAASKNLKGLADEALLLAMGKEQEGGSVVFELPNL
jgi:hypothetical protein